jgi:hypothetical protein
VRVLVVYKFNFYLSSRMHRKNGQFASLKDSYKVAVENCDSSDGTTCPAPM